MSKRSCNLANYEIGDSIAALQGEMRVMHEHTQDRTTSDLLRDQAFQPGLIATGTIDAVCAASIMTPSPSPSKMEIDKAAQTMRNMITRNRLFPYITVDQKRERSVSEGSSPLLPWFY